jgi:DNA excision repair protein ERCC-4
MAVSGTSKIEARQIDLVSAKRHRPMACGRNRRAPAMIVVDAVPSPFTILVDDREGLPFAFANIKGDARDGHKAIAVRTEVRRLKTGDYTIDGYQDRIACERKSHGDLFSTLGNGRERFELEVERLNEMDFAAVVVESSWYQIAFEPPTRSRMNPKCVMRSILAWSQRFPKVHWFPMGTRAMAEATCYRLLERFYRDRLRDDIAEAIQ